jgi:HAD superfamily hydrolase (TIGR01509 family)
VANLEALLFDLDGTLVDTAEANYAAYSAALGEVGIDVSRAAFARAATGRHWRDFLPALVGDALADVAAIAARKRQLYPAMASRTTVNRRLHGLALQARSRRALALVTTASRASATAVLAAHELAALFEVVITGDDVDRPKPAPDPYLLAAARLGLSPAQCLAFEDSDAGVASARSAGMRVRRITFAP